MSTQPAGEQFVARLGEALRQSAALGSVAVGPTPRVEVAALDGVRLWRYGPARAAGGRPPLLIVYSLVNRPYLLDLQPDRSLIGGLVGRGHSVYLIDWGYPAYAERTLSLNDYVSRYIGGCLDEVRRLTRNATPDLLGVCQGGTLALCYAALKPLAVRRLVTMVTPVDFSTPDDALAAYARALDLERVIALFGNLPGGYLRLAFAALKPFANTLGKWVALAEAAEDPRRLESHLRLERWLADSPDQAGAALLEFVQAFYRDNALVRGGLQLDGRPVNLSAIRVPVLNIHATRDHLVPPAASLALARLVGSRVFRSLALDCGHIGVYAGARAAREVPAAISGFLTARLP